MSFGIGGDRMMMIIDNRKKWVYPFLFAVVVLGYGGTLGNDFTYDDRGLILEDQRIINRDWGAIWTLSYWGGTGDGLYRPLVTSSMALNWLISGNQPWGYHLVNLFLHGLAASMFFYLLSRGFGNGAGLIAAVVFALGPGPSEAVFSIVGRAELLACCWGLAALICTSMTGKNRNSIGWLAGSFICLLASIFSKENGVAFALGICLVDLIRERRVGWGCGVAVLAVGVGGFCKWWAIGALSPEAIGYLDNPLAYERPELRLVHGFGLLVRGWLKIIVPWPLVADYSPQHIPLFTHWSEPEIIWPFLLVATLVGCVYRLAKNNSGCVLWIGISGGAILIVSNLFIATGTIFAERLLYIPSMGMSLLWGWGLGMLKAGLIRWILGGWIVIALGVLWGRASEWRDDMALFTSVVEDHPLSARGHFGIGLVLQRQGDLRGALSAYEQAIALYPRYLEAHLNRGAALVALKRLDAARAAYRRILAMRPNQFKARYALGLLDLENGYAAKADSTLKKLHKERPEHLDVLRTLAIVAWQRGDGSAARQWLGKGLDLRPNDGQLQRLEQEITESSNRFP